MSKTLLLIHPDPYIRDMLDICLSYVGWHVLIAGSPLEGLAYAVQDQPDVILFDLSTSGMNFFAFLKRLRKNPLTECIPIVLIGNETDWLQSLPLKDLNVAGLLDYPTDLNQFHSQILELLHWNAEEFCLASYSQVKRPQVTLR
jgi:CheY-like chemotaxis protein